MCGRYSLHADRKRIEAALASALPEDFPADYNIGPGRPVPAKRSSVATGAVAEALHWGMTPRFSKQLLINARIESAAAKPTFRTAWEQRRCIVPASGFYEWKRDAPGKTPHYFSVPGSPVFLFAGLWFEPAEPELPPACVLLTAAANPDIAPVHHRMPVILPAGRAADWLGFTLDRPTLEEEARAVRLDSHPVSTRVNSVRNNGPGLLEASAPADDPQGELF